MKLTPLNDYIACIEVKAPAEMKIGNILIPESVKANENFKRAKVVGVGDGRIAISGERIAPSVKVGDLIVFEKSAGLKLQFPGQVYILIGEDSVLARIEE